MSDSDRSAAEDLVPVVEDGGLTGGDGAVRLVERDADVPLPVGVTVAGDSF